MAAFNKTCPSFHIQCYVCYGHLNLSYNTNNFYVRLVVCQVRQISNTAGAFRLVVSTVSVQAVQVMVP